MTAVGTCGGLLSLAQVAAFLGCPVARVRWYRAEGALPAFYVGTQPVFRQHDVDRLQVAAHAQCRSLAARSSFGSRVRLQRIVQPLLADTRTFTRTSPPGPGCR